MNGYHGSICPHHSSLLQWTISTQDAVEDARVTALTLPPPPQPSFTEMGNNNRFILADSHDSIFYFGMDLRMMMMP